jgi:hypothetical protein
MLTTAFDVNYIRNEHICWRMPMSRTLTLRIDDATYETFARAAAAERRSLSNMIETAALQHIRDSEFVDDAEMEEIMGNADLVDRLKEGSEAARTRKGRLVPPV